MTDEYENNIQAAIDAGYALAAPAAILGDAPLYSVIVPRGGTHATFRAPVLSADRDPEPARPTGVYRPATVDAFIAVVERHEVAPQTTVWVHPSSGRVVAVLNDHGDAGPAWRDHRAELALTITDEWKHWTSKNNRLMSQIEFAEHIEDGLQDIASPPAADMLELAQTFHAHTKAAFRSAHRLSSGQVQVLYDEEVTATAGQSAQMQIPTEFALSLSPFLGESAYAVRALLRYRIKEGSLMLGYKLQRPEAVVQDALAHVAERLGEKFPAVFIGEPGI